MNIDLQELAVAFQKWEVDYRVNPEEYMTTEEIAQSGVEEISVLRAEYLLQLLKEGKN